MASPRCHVNLAGLSGSSYACRMINRGKGHQGIRLGTTGAEISEPAVFTDGYCDPDTGRLIAPVPANILSWRTYWMPGSGYDQWTLGNTTQGSRWKVRWKGTTNSINASLVTLNQSYDYVAKTGTIEILGSASNVEIRMNINDPNDPPYDLEIWLEMYDAQYQAGEMYDPYWLEEMRQFQCIRFMDPQGINFSEMSEIEHHALETTDRWSRAYDSANPTVRGRMPLSTVSRLANDLNRDIHWCIPHLASDAYVQATAEHFRDNVTSDAVMCYEYTNEHWNFSFGQFSWLRDRGNELGITSGYQSSFIYYGHRAAEIMNIIRNVYGPSQRHRWKGVMGSMAASPSVSTTILESAQLCITNVLNNSVTINDLFDELTIANYYGRTVPSENITSVTKANPCVVGISDGHDFLAGEEVYLWFSPNAGMQDLTEQYFTVANPTATTFELQGVDSRSFQDFVPGGDRHGAMRSDYHRIMDESRTRFYAYPGEYRDEYQYFSQVLRDATINGSATSADGWTLIDTLSLVTQRDTLWPAHKAIADSYGLALTGYEGGTHFVGNITLTGFGGDLPFTRAMIINAYTPEMAECSEWCHREWLRLGCTKPSKYVDGFTPSQFGCWAGMRWLPSTTQPYGDNNPVWENIKKWSVSDTPKEVLINLTLG